MNQVVIAAYQKRWKGKPALAYKKSAAHVTKFKKRNLVTFEIFDRIAAEVLATAVLAEVPSP